MSKKKLVIALMLLSFMFVQISATSNLIGNFNSITLNLSDSGKNKNADFFIENNSNFIENDINKNSISQNKIAAFDNSYNYTDQDGTVLSLSSSFVEPGSDLNISINSSAWSNYKYDNSYKFIVESPDGDVPINQSQSLALDNFTLGSNSSVQYSWKNQVLNGTYIHNSTSTGINEEFFGKSINSVVNSSVDATSEKITWQTIGNVTSIVKYGFSINDLNKEVKIESFANSHVVYLTNLFPNTTYYYQVFGLDIFTNMINDSINQFQTPATTTGFPIISNVKITSITNTNAIVTVDTDIISNATLFYSSNKTEVLDNSAVGQIVPALLPNRTDFTFNIADAGSLDPGTEYYFYIKAESGSNVSYNNNSVLFSFVTKTLGIASVLGPLISLFNETHAQINFTTNININATIYYTNDYYSRNDLSGATLIWYPNATTQSIFLKVEPGTRYFFKIGLKNDTKEFWIINQNLNEYFSFTTNPPVEKNEALINITLEIPNYPAVLGVWTFSLQLNQVNKSMVNLPIEKTYSITFIVNTSLIFTFEKLLIKKGEMVNDSGTFEEWDEFNATDLSNEVFSPGDNIGIIGSLAYSTDQVNEINNSDFLYSGNVDLYSGLEKLNSEQFLITEIDSNPINYNITGISGVNNNTMKFMRLNIPSTDIYGNTSVNFTLKFPNVNPANDYIQSESYFNLNVKYRLGVSKTTGKSSYQLTSTNVVGSATIIPYHWSDLKVKYSNVNVSNQLSIPSSELNVTFAVKKDGNEINLFTSEFVNYTLYWFRQTLESSLEVGDYNLSLTWNPDNAIQRLVFESDTLYESNPIIFSYSFKLSVSFEVKDLTEGIRVKPNEDVTLRFKIIVPETGIAWDEDLSPSITDNSNVISYNPLLSEYQVTILAGSDTGMTLLTVTLGSEVITGNNKIKFNVTSATIEDTDTAVDTNPNKELDLSLIDFGLIGISVVVVIAYVSFVFVFNKKK